MRTDRSAPRNLDEARAEREVVFFWVLAAAGGALALAALTKVIAMGVPDRHYPYHDRIQFLEGFVAAAETTDRRAQLQ